MSSSWTWIGTSCLCCAWPLVGSQQLCQFLAGLAWRSLSSDLTTLQTPVVSCPWNVTAKLSFINPWLLCAHRLPLWGQHSRWLVSTDQFTLESVHLTRRRVISWIPISRCACFARPYIHPASRGGAAHTAGFFGQFKHIYKNQSKTLFFQCFYNVFRRKHRNLRGFRNKVGPKQWFLQCFQGSGIKKSSMPWSPQTLENSVIYTVFFNFSMCQCRWPTQTYIQKILQKHCFFQCFYIFSVKNVVIYTFFGLKSVQNTGFCSVFNALASKNHSKYRYLQCFFISVRFSLAGSRPKWPKIPFQYPLKLRHPKIVEKHANTTNTRSRCKIVFAPPPAKADIATAILTNVIKHLV